MKKYCLGVLMMFALMVSVPVVVHAEDAAAKKDTVTMKKDGPKLAIGGYCPVCVLHGNKKKGSSNFTTEYKGKIYRFISMDRQKMFLDDPEKYTKDLDDAFKKLSVKK